MPARNKLVLSWLQKVVAGAQRPIWFTVIFALLLGVSLLYGGYNLYGVIFSVHAILLFALQFIFAPTSVSAAKQIEADNPKLHNSLTATLEGGKYHELSAKFAANILDGIEPHLATPRYFKNWMLSLVIFLSIGLTAKSLSKESIKPKPFEDIPVVDINIDTKNTMPLTGNKTKDEISNKDNSRIAVPHKVPTHLRSVQPDQNLLLTSPEGYAKAIEIYMNKRTE